MKHPFFITPLDSQKIMCRIAVYDLLIFGSEHGTNELLNSFVYSHFGLTSSVKCDSIVSTCNILIDSTCEMY